VLHSTSVTRYETPWTSDFLINGGPITRIPQSPDPRPKDLRQLCLNTDKFESYVIYETESTQAYWHLFQNSFSEHGKKNVQDVRRTQNGTNSELFLRFTQKIHESMTKWQQIPFLWLPCHKYYYVPQPCPKLLMILYIRMAEAKDYPWKSQLQTPWV